MTQDSLLLLFGRAKVYQARKTQLAGVLFISPRPNLLNLCDLSPVKCTRHLICWEGDFWSTGNRAIAHPAIQRGGHSRRVDGARWAVDCAQQNQRCTCSACHLGEPRTEACANQKLEERLAKTTRAVNNANQGSSASVETLLHDFADLPAEYVLCAQWPVPTQAMSRPSTQPRAALPPVHSNSPSHRPKALLPGQHAENLMDNQKHGWPRRTS